MLFNIDEYLSRAKEELQAASVDSWGNEKSGIMTGLAKLYLATGNEAYFTDLCGLIKSHKELIAAAVPACYAYDKTADDEYKNIITEKMNYLKDNFDNTDDEMSLAFYMKYETKLGGKEKYQDVVNRLKAVVSNEKRDNCYCMYVLIEALESIDQAIYEYYDEIKRMFRKCLSEVLEQEEMDSTQMALAGYSILKACRMRAILAERYEETGKMLVSDAMQASESEDMDMGACIIAYAENLLHE